MQYFCHLLVIVFFLVSLEAARVDVLSGFSIFDFPIQLKNLKDAGYEIQMHYQFPYNARYSAYDPELKKIIVFGGSLDEKQFAKLPKEKLLFFIMEPFFLSEPGALPQDYVNRYRRIYTCNDTLVDEKQFFYLPYPHLMPMYVDLPPFEQKKLCALFSGSDNEYPERKNELYSERMKMVEFFETKPEGELDIYGKFWVKRFYRDFRGAIAGTHYGKEKLSVLKNYRFSICFENTKNLNGYITEKIFCCFAAGCVPIYWGPANIESYIPKSCFIDYRDFESREQLYQYIKTMSKDRYEQYLASIRYYLKSEQAQLFAPETFEQIVYDAVVND